MKAIEIFFIILGIIFAVLVLLAIGPVIYLKIRIWFSQIRLWTINKFSNNN